MYRHLYEYLPSIYILAGLLIGLMFEVKLGRWAAAILVLAGMVVMNMRLSYRTRNALK